MQLSSFLFLCFLTIVFILNLILPKKIRWIWLLLASYAFCAFADLRFVLVMLAVTLITWFCGWGIARAESRKTKKIYLLVGVLAALGVLFSFKYLNFSIQVADDLAALLGHPLGLKSLDLILPLGLSFYTFQALSYLLDLYNGTLEPQRNIGKFALYLAFFPKLIAGPIERGTRLLPQIETPIPFDYQRFVAALLRIIWGFFKKLVIADRLAVLVGTVFAVPPDLYAPQVIFAVLAYSLQIYIDFSAYCDIAIGAAALFGIDLSENFNLPYLARTVTEFWRRWHISLSTWLRDYLFTPMNFAVRRKRSKLYQYLIIVFVFFISGIWHGANYTFIVWGLLHGLYQAVEAATLKARLRLEKRFSSGFKSIALSTAQRLLTFGLVSFAWIFFRADNVSQAFDLVKVIASLRGSLHAIAWDFSRLGLTPADFWILAAALILFVLFELFNQKGSLFAKSLTWPLPLRWSVYLFVIFAVILFGTFGVYSAKDFIYASF